MRQDPADHTETWDVSKLLKYLKTVSTTECSLKDLTLKLVILMSLVSAQRGVNNSLLVFERHGCFGNFCNLRHF